MATKEEFNILQEQFEQLQAQVEARRGATQEPVRVVFPPRE